MPAGFAGVDRFHTHAQGSGRRARGAREERRLRRGIAVLLGLSSLLCVGCREIDVARIKGYLGSSDAQLRLGYLYGTGEGGVERDDSASTRWYRRAAEQGHSGAQIAVGNRYLQGVGV